MKLTIAMFPNDVDTFTNQLRTIADRYAAEWRRIGFNGGKSVFFECYYEEDLEGTSDDGGDEWRPDNVIVGTLWTADFTTNGRRFARTRHGEELEVFKLRIERIARELWVEGLPIEDDDIELLFEQSYSARSV
jgi:hypothetical protein